MAHQFCGTSASESDPSDSSNVTPLWPARLKKDRAGKIKDDDRNVVVLLEGDPAFAAALTWDTGCVSVTKLRAMPWPSYSLSWSELDGVELRFYLESHYGASFSANNIEAGVAIAALNRMLADGREIPTT
ncbi:MAG: hypothetical protein IT492_19365 [Gammaproteobacteria bacterium]|nr:hypothetical protein [Gammaproteobacteria bacterium]